MSDPPSYSTTSSAHLRTPQRRPVISATPESSFTSTSTSTTSSSSSILLSDAPTPNNTFSPPDAFADTTRFDRSEVIYDETGDISLNPSLSPLSSRGRLSSYSSHPESRLLPTSLYTSSIATPSLLPHSTRPIPNPPQTTTQYNPSPPFNSHTVSFSAESDIEASTSTSHGKGIGAGGVNVGGGVRQEDVDAGRLQQLGYDAVLGREYTFWSSLAISWLNIGCLQGSIAAVPGAYAYGGPTMILVAWPISAVFSMCLTLTMSELASAYPVSGAMASWAWKAARGGVGRERGWGWLMGGVVLGGHVANVLLVTWEMCNIIAGTMQLSFQYVKQPWHLVLFFLAALSICGVIGTMGWGRSHRFWLTSGTYGLAIWIVLCVTLIATTVTHSGRGRISTDFYNQTGWTSKPYVRFLGWQYCTIASGADASAHMAEETQNPSRNVPNAMAMSQALTYIMGYISIILLLLAINPDDAAEIKSHAFPVGYILERAISRPGAISICCLLITVLVLQINAQLQASSRFVFAMARDDAMPFSETIRRTNSARQPVVAHWIVIGLCAPFSLLPYGSRTALYTVLATTASTLSYMGYTIPVGLYLLSKIDLQQEGRASWSLRRFSKPVGAIGVSFGVFLILMTTLPGHRPVTATSMSWSPVVIAGTCIICYITWRLYGSKHYSGPIRAITKWQTGVEIDLQSTLASRSKVSGDPHTPASHPGGPDDTETDSSFKLAISPYFSDSIEPVTIESVQTLDSDADWGRMGRGVAEVRSGDSGDTTSTVTRETVSRAGREG